MRPKLFADAAHVQSSEINNYMTKKINKNGTDTGRFAEMAKDFQDTFDALGCNIMAAQVCKDFFQFLTPSKIKEPDDLEKKL